MNNNDSFLLGDKKMSCRMKLSFFSNSQEFHDFSCSLLISAFLDRVPAVHQEFLETVRIVKRGVLETGKLGIALEVRAHTHCLKFCVFGP